MIYTVPKLVKIYEVDRRTIIKEIKKGKLKAFKVGNQYRIRQESLDEFEKQGGVSEWKNGEVYTS